MAFTIRLPKLQAIAWLEAAGGTVVEDSGRFRLDGLFALVVGGSRTESVAFDGATRVAEVSGTSPNWTLSRLAYADFRYPAGTLFTRTSPTGPALFCSILGLSQPAQAGSMALLSMTDARATLMPGAGDPGPGVLQYPVPGGSKAVSVSTVPHPDDPGRFGRFVLPAAAGHVVCLGVPQQRIVAGTVAAIDLAMDSYCLLYFELGPAAAASSTRLWAETAAAGATRLRTEKTSRLRMATNPSAPRWDVLNLPIRRIDVTDGNLRVTQFHSQEVWLGHTDQQQTAFADVTTLFTTTDRLSFEIGLMTGSRAVRLAYSDPEVAKGVSPAGAAKYYGLRIAGLGGRTGTRPAFDATNLCFEASAQGVMELKAGLNGGLLVPKLRTDATGTHRAVDVPVSTQLALRVSAPVQPAVTALSIDTELASAQFKLFGPSLIAAPLGISARLAGTDAGTYGRWALGYDGPAAEFNLISGRIEPVRRDKWLNDFHTANPSATYALLEHPGFDLMIDGPPSPPRLGPAGVSGTNRTELTTKSASGKETVAYTAFFVVMGWAAVKFLQNGKEYFLNETRFKVGFPNLEDATIKDFVLRNGLQDLAIAFRASDGGAAQIRKFIDFTRADQKIPDGKKFLWPFASGLSALLYDGEQKLYCDQIAAAKPRKRDHTCLAFDYSATGQFAPGKLGFTLQDWNRLQQDSPALWPRGLNADGSLRDGARLDPSVDSWRGIFLRDMPLFLPTPPIVGEESKFLQGLIDKLNDNLVLDYGWRDESGATWSAGLAQNFADGRFTPKNWEDVLEMSLRGVTLKGAAGAVVSAEGLCEIHLNRIKDKSGNPVQLEARFGFDLVSGKSPITRIDVTQNGDPIATEDIPGFQSVALRRVSTDFKTAQFELLLLATPALANALPFLSSKVPQPAAISFNLKGEPEATLSLALSSEIQTKLFGRWPWTVQAMSVKFGGDETVLTIQGRFHLGTAEFASVGGSIIVTKNANGLEFDVQIHEISGKFKVGDFKLSAGLQWSKGVPPAKVTLADAAREGKDRDFWGHLDIDDPGVLGKNSLAVRIGNSGEISFWIATIALAKSIPIGIGRLKNPALLLAHNADFGDNLANVVADPTGSMLEVVRPGPKESTNDWLAKWKPSSKIGMVIAGSGYVELQEMVAEAAVKDDKIDPTKLTSLLFTDRGLIRIDGLLMMLGVAPIRFGLVLDYERKRIVAGMQAPEIKVPPEDPQYEISPGYITIGVSFRGGDPWLRVGLGWPERVGGTEFERDWSKATKVRINSMYPINTFWGGYLAELTRDYVRFGYAVRAGYTKNYSVGGGVARGSAELGVTLGGVFQFTIGFGEEASAENAERGLMPFALERSLVASAGLPPAEAALFIAVVDDFDRSVKTLSSLDLALVAEIYGDIWGKASVEFLGVTLASISIAAFARFRVCGSLRRGITQAKAQVGFEVSVTILCISYSTRASVDIVFIDGECPNLARTFLDWDGDLPRRLCSCS